MRRIKLTKNFYLDEYIPEDLYKELIHKPYILIGLLDWRMIHVDQKLRMEFGSVTINNWWLVNKMKAEGKTNIPDIRNWSGLRTSDSSWYSKTSQHTFGRASDKIFKEATAKEVRDYIKINWKELGITCIEDNISWVHSDVRYVEAQTKLYIV